MTQRGWSGCDKDELDVSGAARINPATARFWSSC